ncbi:TonB-dependent receptor plug domain-containing protein [Allopusillimonas ginsengisoli]|uniref:TonB-dependent receptor plug domain-containing protein n=1 Tax=Allopusillimonas ginsengisoli TaxID=453575 RepID=UPI0010C22172|nr:TonB-dependent receptor [Allopusillimonas ginsengisoli]
MKPFFVTHEAVSGAFRGSNPYSNPSPSPFLSSPRRRPYTRYGLLAGMAIALVACPALATIQPTQLDAITVSSTSGGTTDKTTWQSVQKSTLVDMKDVLENQSGVNVSGGNGASQQIFIRGLGENQVVFSVDGANQNAQIFHHQSRFMFDPALLKSVAIEKGSGSASAGIGVTGGAIRMTTVDAQDLLEEGRSLGFKAGAGWRSNKGWERSGAVYGKFGEHVDAIFIGNLVTQKDYKDGHGNRVSHSALDQDGYLAKVGLTLSPQHRFVVSQRREQQEGYRPLRFNVAGLRGLPTFDSKLVQDTSSLQYHGKKIGFADGVDINLFHIKMNDVKDATGPMPTTGRILPAHSDASAKTTGADLGLVGTLWSNHTLKYGLNWRDERISTAKYTVGRGREGKTDWGAYVEGIWDFTPFTLTTGLRYDHFRITDTSNRKGSGSNLNPSASLIYEATPQLTLKASAAQASRSPRLYEPYILGLAWGDSRKLAEGIKAERAVNMELGAEWAGEHFSAMATVFRQNINDYIGTTAARYQDNIGRLVNRGYEVGLGYRDGGFRSRLAMSYSKPRVNDAYKAYVLDNMPTGRQWLASVSYRLPLPAVEIGWRGRLFEHIDIPTGEGAARTTVRKAGYGVHDVYLNWQPQGNDRMNVNVSINNVDDKFYYNQAGVCTPPNMSTCLPEAGRNYRISFNYRY